MTGEFDDDADREHERLHHDQDDDGDRCPGGPDDDSHATFGPDYVSNLLLVQDAAVKDDSLDLLVPDLSDRWPEPRLLWQQDVWFLRHRTRVPVRDLDPDGARWLLGAIQDLAQGLHQVASRDEALTTSSGLRRAMAHAGVPLVAELDPADWLESTLLVRALRDRCR